MVSLTISTNNNSVHVTNIRKAQSLTELSLEISEWFTEEDILAISELKQLQTLKLGQKGGYTALIPTALRNLHLVAHPLEELEFHFLRDKLNDISNFHNLKKLKKLYLYGLYAITYEEFSGYTQTFQLIVTGLNTLKDCPHLEELGISGLNTNMETIKLIGEFPKSLKKVIFGLVFSISEEEVKLLQAKHPNIEFVITTQKKPSPIQQHNTPINLNDLL